MFPVNLIHAKATTAGLPYLLIGGHAVNAYCPPRATLDVDFLVRKEDRTTWTDLLTAEGFTLKHEAESFLQFSPPYGINFRLDLMLVSRPTFTKLQATARPVACLGLEALVPTALNLIALKIHAICHGPEYRRNKDWLDIENLVRATGLDSHGPELREVFHRQGTTDLYDAFLKRCAHDRPSR